MTRLTILSNDEIKELYKVPIIEEEKRSTLFKLLEFEQKYIDAIKPSLSIPVKINLILQLGYFKAMRKFYKISFLNTSENVWFVIKLYFPGIKFPKKNININQHYNNQKIVLDIHQYKRASAEFLLELESYTTDIIKTDASPKFIFDQLLDYCEIKKIVRPGYSILQGIIAKVVLYEEQRLITKISKLMDSQTQKIIDDLLSIDDLFYKLTSLKKDPKGFTTKEMRLEVSKQKNISTIHGNVKFIVENLDISRHNILYYADLAQYYSIFSLTRMRIEKARLYLICYVLQRFWKINDHLISYFIYKNTYYQGEAKKYAISQVYQAKVMHDQNTNQAAKILQIIENDQIKDEMIRPKAFKIVKKDKFNKFITDLSTPKFKDLPHIMSYYSRNYNTIRLNLRSIFLNLNFTYEKDSTLKSAIIFFKDFLKLRASTHKLEDQNFDDIPTSFIPRRMKPYIIKQKKITTETEKNKTANPNVNKNIKASNQKKYIDANLYEIILYLEIRKAIGSKVFIYDSESYRSLEDELIPIEVWNENKDNLIKTVPNCIISTPIDEILQSLELKLEESYKSTNQRIINKDNKHIKVDDKTSKWKLAYQKQEEEINNPFFDDLSMINLSDCLLYVEKQTNFLKHFTHILSKNVKTSPKIEHFNAYFIAAGTGLGKGKMAMSSDITEDELDIIEQNYIRLETLKNANDQIINDIAKLTVFKYYNLSEYGIIASVDGQKIPTKFKTYKARYSEKYFGGVVGVVFYSFIANHLPISSIIIGANEHESQYTLDIFLNNTSNIKPIAVASDMHNVNRYNGGLLYLFKCQFMPRFTRIYKSSTKNLVGFRNLTSYKDLLIKPSTKISKGFIKNNWDAVTRIIVSLAKKHTSQNQIIKKLSFNKNNPTLKALASFDSIVMSIYMLNYIDDIKMRQIVEKALNRGESFHQLRSAIMKISGKQLQGRTEFELSINNETNRLLALCIIHYSCSLLSSLLEVIDSKTDKELYTLVTRMSPVAWKHINMIGKFQFLEKIPNLDIKSMIDKVMSIYRKKLQKKQLQKNK